MSTDSKKQPGTVWALLALPSPRFRDRSSNRHGSLGSSDLGRDTYRVYPPVLGSGARSSGVLRRFSRRLVALAERG